VSHLPENTAVRTVNGGDPGPLILPSEVSMNPLIGITPSTSPDDASRGYTDRYLLSRSYVDSVRRAGGIPVILPTDSDDAIATLERLDGLLLSGGSDVDPARYGEATVHPATYGIDHDRDAFEIAAFRAATERDLPTLCICRGIQVMAVAMGGTLIQDIPSELPGSQEHQQNNLDKKRGDVTHSVRIDPGNPLFDSIGQETIAVNTYHHQAVSDPGSVLKVIATSEDGVVEGLWHPGMTYGIGVQWHPEGLSAHMPEHAAIFEGFVESIRSNVRVS
jgi:putative glutamine amidotransferase